MTISGVQITAYMQIKYKTNGNMHILYALVLYMYYRHSAHFYQLEIIHLHWQCVYCIHQLLVQWASQSHQTAAKLLSSCDNIDVHLSASQSAAT